MGGVDAASIGTRVTREDCRTQHCDVLVLGSGGAGLTAGLTTSVGGLQTVIAEKSDKFGGTTAISAAGLWVPANRRALEAGISDSSDEAFDYIRSLAPPTWPRSDEALWRRFAIEAPHMLDFVEAHSPLRFELTPQSDPFIDRPGAKRRGRMVSPRPLSRRILDGYSEKLRHPMLSHIFTYQEALQQDPYHRPLSALASLLPWVLWRLLTSSRGMGTALVVGLLKGCIAYRCRFELMARALELLLDERGHVAGAILRRAGRELRILARHGVVLATGGFEWDPALRGQYFPGPVDFVTSPPGNEGDGHHMALMVGAELACMDQANMGPALPIVYEGRIQGMSYFLHHEPNAIIVDRNGRRFVDEFRFNIGEVIDERDPVTGMPIHLPAWMISDARLLSRAPIIRWSARRNPDWIVRAQSLTELAGRINVPAEALTATVTRFNGFAIDGIDQDFGRGAARRNPVRVTGQTEIVPIEYAPFLAIPFNRSFISTKGGPRTNARGEVLRPDGGVIGGLYCAGVAMANPIGTWAVGAGTTLGPNMTWGYICGRTILENAGRAESVTAAAVLQDRHSQMKE